MIDQEWLALSQFNIGYIVVLKIVKVMSGILLHRADNPGQNNDIMITYKHEFTIVYS